MGISSEDDKLIRKHAQAAHKAYYKGMRGDFEDCYESMVRYVEVEDLKNEKFEKAFNKYSDISDKHIDNGDFHFVKPFKKFITDWKQYC